MKTVEWHEFTSIGWHCPDCEANNDIYWEDWKFNKKYTDDCAICWEIYNIIPR